MKTVTFRPLRRVKKSGKVIVASYMQWNKVKATDFQRFILNVINEYSDMPKNEYVHNHNGELLYWCGLGFDNISSTKFEIDYSSYKNNEMVFTDLDYCNIYHTIGLDVGGTPTFSHFTADYLGTHFKNMNEWEPLTVGTVVKWFGWFLYQLKNSQLEIVIII